MSKATDFKNNVINSISLETAKDLAPAIFATSPAPTIKSPKYQFTPTFEVIEQLTSTGEIMNLVVMPSNGSLIPDYEITGKEESYAPVATFNVEELIAF